MPRQLFANGIAVSSNQPEIRKRYNAQNKPYTDRTEVFNDNDETTFYLGQTFFIDDGNEGVREYWFESAVAAETDLVLKNPESTRIVDSIASLRALNDLKMGDYVRTYGYHAGSHLGGGLFKVAEEPVDTVHLNGSGTNGNINVQSLTVAPGTVFKMRFRIMKNSIPSGNNWYVMIMDQPPSNRFGLLALDGGGSSNNYTLEVKLQSASAAPTPSYQFTLRDQLGNMLNPNLSILYDEWYEVEIEVVDFAPFNSNLNMGYTFQKSMNLEVEWFEMNGSHFPLNEGSGSTINSSTGPSISGSISGDFSWDQLLPLDDGALHIRSSNNMGLTKQLPNNRVTPFDYGAVNNESVTDYINDSTSAIQDAIDSGYDVDIPPSRLYITESLKIKSAVQIRMHGSFMPMNDSGHEVTISDEANTTTILYSDKNIDYIIIQSRNVEIYDGLLYTFGSVDHSKAGILFDISYPMWKTDIVGVGVYGNSSYFMDDPLLGTTGTTAFKIDCENLDESGYLSEGHIDGRAYWCHKGVELTPMDPSSTAYVNNIDFAVTGFGCQVYYDFAFGGLFSVTSVGQDANVLLPVDQPKPEYTAFQFHNCHDCTFDVFLFDPQGIGSHNGNNYAISGENNTIKGQLLTKYNDGEIELYGVASLNRNTIVKNPAGLVLSNNAGFISQFDNAIAFAGNEGKVSYVGYKAENQSYFEGNFPNPSDTYLSDIPNVVDTSTDVTIHNGEALLTNSPISEYTGHSIANVTERELHFAEIVIDDLENMQTFGDSPLKQLLLSISGANINAIECILHFQNINSPFATSEEHRLIEPDNAEFLDGSLFNLFGYRYAPNKNHALRMIIIRLIGQEGSASNHVFVSDIGVETKDVKNKPNINIGGAQTIYGQHTIAEQLGADEFRYTNKPSAAGDGGGYGDEVLQLKKYAEGAIGLYNLNNNDDVAEATYGTGTNIVLTAGQQVDIQCNVDTAAVPGGFTTNGPLTAQNGTIDVMYRIVNADQYNRSLNKTSYITRLFADGTKIGEVAKEIRGVEKIESISFPVTTDYPKGTVFSATVEVDRSGLQMGNATYSNRLRVTKSFLVPRPGVAVADADTVTPTAAENATTINNLLTALRNAGFIE